MNIKCIAVEDEPLALEKLKSFIGKLPQLDLAATFRNAQSALEFIRHHPVHLIFLDIRMDGVSGIEMIEQMDIRPQVIFTTAYHEYAIRAFELAATDYLLKPYTFERFCQAVNKADEYIKWKQSSSTAAKTQTDYIFVKSGYKLLKVILKEVLYIEGMRDYQCIVTADSKVLASITFQELVKILPAGFVRCQKSYIVSISKIESIENDRIKIGNKYIPIGETYKESFYKQI
jgi:DNA-binding LytR/AlgR family response regulator